MVRCGTACIPGALTYDLCRAHRSSGFFLQLHVNLYVSPSKGLIFKKIYVFVHKQGEQAEGEAGSPLSREPDEGLDPRTLRS